MKCYLSREGEVLVLQILVTTTSHNRVCLYLLFSLTSYCNYLHPVVFCEESTNTIQAYTQRYLATILNHPALIDLACGRPRVTGNQHNWNDAREHFISTVSSRVNDAMEILTGCLL
ncbi:uncharacterized protein ALTATR162_LOCUS3845 [Alternaria atra]|uniref:Uncharacterized protein n=1 Tax=Alternaria atra TaxID=119953 RepID=A0A8J2I0W1_9PLEO|nr:uncharacterized protein ALTATR162_LOCUS3845 [Alternaria atra]CAG5155808.1 unnamed protein product [Alternaria atra]